MIQFETIHEMDYDGDTGSLVGFILEGHGHTLEEVEAFVNGYVEEYYGSDAGHSGSWMVREAWWRTVPFVDDWGEEHENSYVYVYDKDDSKGGAVGTLVEHDVPWSRECFKHRGIVAYTGFPEQQIIDSEDIAIEGYVYTCRECSEVLRERLEIARRGLNDV